MAQAAGDQSLISDGSPDVEAPSMDPATILRCIGVLKARSRRHKDKGLNKMTFFFGVTNVLIVTWCLGAVPEDFWVVYIVETVILFWLRWKHMIHAEPCEVYYWLDFCWVANMLASIALIAYLVDAYFNSPALNFLMVLNASDVRETLFCMFWGIATGPLLCAVGALGNALVFHDVDNTVGVFIHLTPSLLAYTLRWHREAVLEAWPGMFHLNYLDRIRPWHDIYVKAALVYFLWSLLYTFWMVLHGMRLPHKGYDTIFHCTMRSSPGNPVEKILGWSKEESARRGARHEYTTKSLLVYMLLHSLAVYSAIIVSILCFYSRAFHMVMNLAMALAAIYRGSARYSHYILNICLNDLQTLFEIDLKSRAQTSP